MEEQGESLPAPFIITTAAQDGTRKGRQIILQRILATNHTLALFLVVRRVLKALVAHGAVELEFVVPRFTSDEVLGPATHLNGGVLVLTDELVCCLTDLDEFTDMKSYQASSN